jgi:hypothetical protein
MDEIVTPPSEEAPTRSSLFGRLVNIFAAPGEVYAEVKTSPPCTANWVVPALVYALVGLLGFGLMLSQDSLKQQLRDMQNQAIEKQMAKTKASPAQIEQAQQMAEKFGTIGTIVSGVLGTVAVAFVSPFWWGLILWLVGAKIFKGDFGFMRAVEVAGLSLMIDVLDAVVRPLLAIGLGSFFATPSLALLVKEFDPTNTVHGLLALVNVMTFWVLAVKAVGLAKLGGVSFGKAAVWVFGIWAVYTGAFLGLGLALRRVFGG